MTADELAQIIRRVDGNHSLGAGELAEAILAALPPIKAGEAVPVAWIYELATAITQLLMFRKGLSVIYAPSTPPLSLKPMG